MRFRFQKYSNLSINQNHIGNMKNRERVNGNMQFGNIHCKHLSRLETK